MTARLRVPYGARWARLAPGGRLRGGPRPVPLPAETPAAEVEEIVAEHFLASRRCVTDGERLAARLGAEIALQIPRDYAGPYRPPDR